MLDFIRWLMSEGRIVRLAVYRTFFVAGAFFAMTTLGWIDVSVITTPLPEMPLTVASLLIASGLLFPILVSMESIVSVCRWSRRRLLCDARLLHEADPESMTSSQKSDFEYMTDALREFDVAMGTALAGLAILTVSQHLADPASTAWSVADLLAPIGCIFLLLWLAAGALVLRRAEQGRYGRRLALTLLVRQTARLRKRRFLSRLPRRLVVRQYRGLRAT